MSGVDVPEYNAAIESSREDSIGVPVARPNHFAVSIAHSRENRQRIALRGVDSPWYFSSIPTRPRRCATADRASRTLDSGRNGSSRRLCEWSSNTAACAGPKSRVHSCFLTYFYRTIVASADQRRGTLTVKHDIGNASFVSVQHIQLSFSFLSLSHHERRSSRVPETDRMILRRYHSVSKTKPTGTEDVAVARLVSDACDCAVVTGKR